MADESEEAFMEHNIQPQKLSMRKGFMRVEEVAQELGISKSHAYKVIHKC